MTRLTTSQRRYRGLAGMISGFAVLMLGVALAVAPISVGPIFVDRSWLFGGAFILAGVLLVAVNARSTARARRNPRA